MKLLLGLFICSISWAQPPTQGQGAQSQYGFMVATGDVTVSSSASTTLTIQQPKGVSRTVLFQNFVAQCKANSFDIAQTQNGTDATATTATILSLNPQQPSVSSKALAYTASNVSGGTAIGNTDSYSAVLNPVVYDLRPIGLPQNSPNVNYSVTITNTGATSDTCRIRIQWVEQ